MRTKTIVVIIITNLILSSTILYPGYSLRQSTIHTIFDTYYQTNSFALRGDHNVLENKSININILENLYNKSETHLIVDPDPDYNDIFSMIYYSHGGFDLLLLGLEKIKRKIDLGFGLPSLTFESLLNYIKILQHYTIEDTDENVITSQDFLGYALIANGTGFSDEFYLQGFSNIPLEAIYIKNSTDGTNELLLPIPIIDINIMNESNSFSINYVFSNISFLFQSNNVELGKFTEFDIDDRAILMVIDKVNIKFDFKQYQRKNFWVLEVEPTFYFGNIIKLVINENSSPMIPNYSWNFTETKELALILSGIGFVSFGNFTIYQNTDIDKRLSLFSTLSLCFLTSRNVGVIGKEGEVIETNTIIDGEKRSSIELHESNWNVDSGIIIESNEKPILETVSRGRQVAISYINQLTDIEFIQTRDFTLSWYENNGLSIFSTFNSMNDILRDLTADYINRQVSVFSNQERSISQILADSQMTYLGTKYVLNHEIEHWNGKPVLVRPLHISIKNKNEIKTKSITPLTEVSPYSYETIVIGIITCLVFKKLNNKRKYNK